MPIDRYADDESEDVKASRGPARAARTDFDCPSCNANNPLEQGPAEGEELLCNYCGTQYLVKVLEDGRLRLKEL